MTKHTHNKKNVCTTSQKKKAQLFSIVEEFVPIFPLLGPDILVHSMQKHCNGREMVCSCDVVSHLVFEESSRCEEMNLPHVNRH